MGQTICKHTGYMCDDTSFETTSHCGSKNHNFNSTSNCGCHLNSHNQIDHNQIDHNEMDHNEMDHELNKLCLPLNPKILLTMLLIFLILSMLMNNKKIKPKQFLKNK